MRTEHNESLARLRRGWRATGQAWHLTLLGEALLRARQIRRARVVLEAAVRMEPFHVLAGSLLIQAAQAEGDVAGALRARDLTFAKAGAELPPEPW